MKAFSKLGANPTLSEILRTLVAAAELNHSVLRRNEKRELNDANKSVVRAPIRGRVSDLVSFVFFLSTKMKQDFNRESLCN